MFQCLKALLNYRSIATVRERVKLQLIPNTVKWRMTSIKRRAKLKSQISDLVAICDVPALFIYFDSNGKIDAWPEEPNRVADIIQRFRRHKKSARKNQLNQAGYLVKLEAELCRLIEGNTSLPFFIWDHRLDCLPFEALMELVASLESKKILVQGRIQSLLQNPNPNPDNAGLLQYLPQNPNPNVANGNHGDGLSHANGGLLQSLFQNHSLRYNEGLSNVNGALLQPLLLNPNPNIAVGHQSNEGLGYADDALIQSLPLNPNPNKAMSSQPDEGLSHANGGLLQSLLQNPSASYNAGLSNANGALLQPLLLNPNPNIVMGYPRNEGLCNANDALRQSLLLNPNPNKAMKSQADEELSYVNGGLLHSLLQNPNPSKAMGNQAGEGWSSANGCLMDQGQPLLHKASSQGQNPELIAVDELGMEDAKIIFNNLNDLDYNVSSSSFTMRETIHKDYFNCGNASLDDYFTFIPPLMPFRRLELDVNGSRILEPSSSYHFGGDP